jgi:endonuclease/exonuclease/phosphatase family metal-dependent hydrolase
MRMRVVSYNVRSLGRGAGAVAEAIAELDPDIALLQECGSRPDLFRMAETLGMQAVSTHRPLNRVRNAVLYREPWRATWREIRDFPRLGRTLRRGFVAVQLRQAGARLTVVSAHLGLVPVERSAHAAELADFAAVAEGPVAIGVDLNEGPEGPAARWMAARLFDAFAQAGEGRGRTFPAAAPSARIDFVFVSGGVDVQRAWVGTTAITARASDHLPVAANLEIAPA